MKKIFAKFRKKRKQPKTEALLNLVHTSPDGTKWYEYDNPLQMPARRAISAEVATRMADMNITKDKLRELLAKMREFANRGEVVSCFALMEELTYRLDYIGEEETLRDFALVYFLIDEEKPNIVDEVARAKKMALFDEFPETYSFFLQKGFDAITKYSDISEVDINAYLLNQKESERRLSSYLQGR